MASPQTKIIVGTSGSFSRIQKDRESMGIPASTTSPLPSSVAFCRATDLAETHMPSLNLEQETPMDDVDIQEALAEDRAQKPTW